MKKNHLLASYGLMSLLLSGCGKGSVLQNLNLCFNGVLCSKKKSEDKEPSRNRENKKLSCLLAPATHNTVFIGPDEDIKLYSQTTEKVLGEIRKIKNYDPDKFWEVLRPETRDLLNYELNLIIANTNKTMNEEALYRATAFFFSRVRNGFSDDLVYQVKYSSDLIFSFKLRAVETRGRHRFSKDCGKIETKDVIYFNVPEVVKRYSSVKQIYECRSESLNMILMETEDLMYLSTQTTSSEKRLLRLSAQDLEKNDRKTRLKLRLDSPDVSFTVQVKKKREGTVGEWSGSKAKLEFRSSEIGVDEEGACVGLIHAFRN